MVVETRTRGITVFDPTVEPDPIESTMAPRLATLDGKRVGLLANGKRNSEALLEQIEALLETRYTIRGVVRATKPNVSRPAPDPIMEQLSECDLVLTAIGD